MLLVLGARSRYCCPSQTHSLLCGLLLVVLGLSLVHPSLALVYFLFYPFPISSFSCLCSLFLFFSSVSRPPSRRADIRRRNNSRRRRISFIDFCRIRKHRERLRRVLRFECGRKLAPMTKRERERERGVGGREEDTGEEPGRGSRY